MRAIRHLWMFASDCHLDYQDGTSEIVDAPLMLISRMGKGACRYCLCLSRQPVTYLWMGATNLHIGYPRCKTKDHWHSIDAYFQNGAVTVSLVILPKKAANRLVMNCSDRITLYLPELQDQKSLMLCWPSFCHRCIHNMQSFTLA